MNWLRDRAARRQAAIDQVTRELSGAEPTNTCMFVKPTLRQRISHWLFPPAVAADMPELDGFAPGNFETHLVWQTGWKDRLRFLLTGRIHAVIRSKTDVVITKVYSTSTVWVESAHQP